MTEFNRNSPEWKATREWAAVEASKASIALRKRIPEDKTADLRTRIELLGELVRAFEPEEIEKFERELDYNL